ncbi:MAG: hypothetical protein AAGG11_10200 [Pseudomonadota bacterium]
MARACPNCGQETLPLWRIALWPVLACTACGSRVRLNTLFFCFYFLGLIATAGLAVLLVLPVGPSAPAYLVLEALAIVVLVALYGGLEPR